MNTRYGQMAWAVSLAFVWAAGGLAGDSVPKTAPDSAGDGVVILNLRRAAWAAAPYITVGDVATLGGGEEPFRQKVASLDLADRPKAGQTVMIGRDQVAFRLRVAGIEPRLFRVIGAAQVAVSLGSREEREEEVLAWARQFLLQRLPWPSEDVNVEPAQPIQLPALKTAAGDQVRLEAELPPGVKLTGRVPVEVFLVVNGERRSRVLVYLAVTLHPAVGVTTRPLAVGDILTAENVHWDHRAVDGSIQYLTRTEWTPGLKSKRILQAGQILTKTDVDLESVGHPVLVQQRELVKLVAQVGPLWVTAKGEALQDGRAGEVIRVRNVDSKTIVQGKVVDRAVVEVSY